MEGLTAQLAQLSAEEIRALLAASGHADIAADGAAGSAAPVSTGAGSGDVSLSAEERAREAQQHKDEGNACFRQGRFEDAVRAYSRCAALEPANAVCLSNRAAALLKLKRYEDAIADCSSAIRLAPSIKPYMRRAAAYIARGDFLLAVKDLATALDYEPNNKECATKLEAIVARTLAAFRSTELDTTSETEKQRRAWLQACVVRSVHGGWRRHEVKGNPSPGALNGHALFRGPDDRIYLFGGRSVRDNKANLFVRDDSDCSWDVVPTDGHTPHSRAWHSVSLIDAVRGILCVYGGVSSLGEDPRVYLLLPDLTSNTNGATTARVRKWRWVEARSDVDKGQVPDARSGHAAVSVASRDRSDTSVYLFGGRTKRGVSSSLYELSLVTATDCDRDTVRWKLVETNHQNGVPAARDGHSMCVVCASDDQPPRLIVFGGNGQQNDEKMNDTWAFDVATRSWEVLECSGDVPSPRSYHSAHAIGQYMFVIGGRTVETEDSSVYVLDTATGEWFHAPILREHQLSPRAWHASVLTSAGSIFLLGGGTFHGPLRDAATLDLGYLMRSLRDRT